MPDNTGLEENDVETTAEQAPVIWPEPSRLDSWWHRIMTDNTASAAGTGSAAGTASPESEDTSRPPRR